MPSPPGLRQLRQLRRLLPLLLLVAGLLPVRVQAAECPRLPGGFSASVSHVYDGDTLKLADGRKVRLIGVNTPELGRDGGADEPQARAARHWLQQRALNRSVYLLPGRESHDRYGRLLAHVYLPDDGLAAEGLVRAGLGYGLGSDRDPRLARCVLAAEAGVRQRRAGVWRQPPVQAVEVDRGGFALVSGRISRMTPTRKGLYIDLDQRLALFLPASIVAQTGAEDWRPGQRLEARGWVVDRLQRKRNLPSGQMRWRLNITHPLHLKAD